MIRAIRMCCLLGLGLLGTVLAQDLDQERYNPDRVNTNKFKQLGQELPTPNVYRNGAGAPGHMYWENRANYEMEITLDDNEQRIYGEETITYENQSPDPLTYLWLQLDQNVRQPNSMSDRTQTGTMTNSNNQMSFRELERMHREFPGGFHIEWVKDDAGQDLPHTINETMMRVDLPEVLAPGEEVSFQVKWWYQINNRLTDGGGRSGMEYFEENDNYLYTIAQFFPRMCVYNDVYGWQNKQFLGRGEFTLSFGDYQVSITAPSDHVVGATGMLQNTREVLTKAQRNRMEEARKASEPVMIVTPEEALEAEQGKATDTKTWTFEAENVRDFAFCSSRKFIWDAVGVPMGDRTVLAMSYYPKEGNPLWERYSTRVVAHTLKWYSHYTFDYPYPVAISVHTDRIGMEYPMICFNGGRPDPDGTYSERTKYGMISVIIHEVGHNYFPMIVNSDERQWTWMDEGLNSFLQYLTEQQWQRDYPSRRGPAPNIVDYMKGDKTGIMPIMTNSESVFQFGNNAYGKPATALNIMRETVLGRDLFDFAFKQYAQRWMFKQPMPADLFRTMEDASGTDLDWFWRGWFYTTDHVDIELADVQVFQVNSQDPEVEKPIAAEREVEETPYIGDIRNQEDIPETVMEANPELQDFYNQRNENEVSIIDQLSYRRYLERLTEEEKALLSSDKFYYQVTFKNIGGLVMPLILKFTYADGSEAVKRIPAEIWRYNSEQVTKVFMTDQEVTSIVLDPYKELADTDTYNNYWPRRPQPTRFELYKRQRNQMNPMQVERRIQEMREKGQLPSAEPAEGGNE
jgi:hypothetical protein